MTTLQEFVYSEMDEPDSLDVVGLGPADREEDNQWLYDMTDGFSEVNGLDQVNDYWLGFEEDDRDYDIEGDVFEQDFYDESLKGDASLLVAPKPSIYRGAAIEDNSYTSNYIRFAELVHTGLDAVLMRQVGEDFDNMAHHLEFSDMAENFRNGFQKKAQSMQEMEPSDMANIVQNQPEVHATHLEWETKDEQIILATGKQRP